MAGLIVWHLTMSLDGFMADRAGSLAWLATCTAPAPMGARLVPTLGAVLTGRRTHDIGMATDPTGAAYGGAYAGPVFVLTHRAPEEPDGSGATFLTDGLERALRAARAAAGEASVVVLGADLGQQCLHGGHLDELLVHVAPVFLGGGTPVHRSDEAVMVAFDVLERSGPAETTTLRLRPRVAPARSTAEQVPDRGP